MICKRLFTSLITILVSLSAMAQVFDNKVFDKRVQTVILARENVDDRYPIIALGTNERLELGFDMMEPTNEFFQYTILHCDANWRPTPMAQTEYIQGITFDNINDWKFSNNTYVTYVHYSVLIPNQNMRPMITGNYILKVYRNFDEEDLVLTRRFMVVENRVQIDAKVLPSTLAKFRFTQQEITFNVNYRGYTIVDPFNDVRVVILQNNSWDNAKYITRPQFIRDQVLEYNDFEQALFPGGNEFRFFDFRSLRQVSPNVRSKTRDTIYNLFLNFEESRGSSQYLQYLDNNGRRIIANRDGVNYRFDGDYANVNFYLLTMNQVQQSDVYVYGEFTDWKLLPEYKMSWNRNRSRYELNTILKQGRYEYFYAINKPGTNEPDITYFEGNHSNTENEYMILVYHRNIQFKYDELIGVRKFVTQFAR